MHWADLVHWWLVTPSTEIVWLVHRAPRAAPVLDALFRAMDRHREGAGEHHSRDVLVFQLLWRHPAARLCRYRADPVFILGQATGLIIYSRNIYFIWLGKREPGSVKAA